MDRIGQNEQKIGGKGRNINFRTKLHIFTSWFGLNIGDGRMLGVEWMKMEVQGLKRNQKRIQNEKETKSGD